MTLSTQPYKGARDFYPEDKRIQNYLFKQLRTVAERYGYEETDAPILEPLDLYLSKTSEEIVNEQTYSFTDRGGRQVTLRPEWTPTISRMVAARRQELAYPLRLYAIPNVWRYERPQRGRLREHWQFNVDIFGVDNLSAEHEIIMLADNVLQSFGAKRKMYVIKLNSRQLVNQILTVEAGLDATQSQMVVRLIDRMHKMERAVFLGQLEALLNPSQREAKAAQRIMAFLEAGSLDQLPQTSGTAPHISRLRRLLELLRTSGVENAVFDATLMRGFDYYTDIVFEVFDLNPENNRSMFGGGRYDGLVGLFGVEPLPTAGFGMGDVTLRNFLEGHGLLPAQRPETDLYVVLIGDVYQASQPALQELRNMGVSLAVDGTGRKPEKQLKAAIKKGIKHVLFIGESELSSKQFMLKDLQTGEEGRHSLQRIVSIVSRRPDDDELLDD